MTETAEKKIYVIACDPSGLEYRIAVTRETLTTVLDDLRAAGHAFVRIVVF